MRKNIKWISFIGFMCFLIIGLGFYYFTNKSKWALEKQVAAMKGMHINLDFENARTIINGIDSSYTSTSKNKLIIFVDSTSCSCCFIKQLPSYIELNDSLVSKGQEVIVVLHPTRAHKEEVLLRLKDEVFPFLCILDTEGEFVKHNPEIPNNRLLHSFTINEDNNLILIGDPTKNIKLRKLLFQTI